MAGRDRDHTGRPQNARPRDELGRPLPHGSTGVPRIPDELELPPDQTLRYAQSLLDQGRAFHAHEVLEAAWKHGPSAERELWQGLAQLAVGITHVQRGNAVGAAKLLRRAAGRLAQYRGAAHGVDVDGLIAHARGLADSLDTENKPAADRLRPRLTELD